MKREDLRSRIIPTTIQNTDEFQHRGNIKFDTTDLLYLDSFDEQYDGKKTHDEIRRSATDFALMNNAYIYSDYTTRTGKHTTWSWLRSSYNIYIMNYVFGDGSRHNRYTIHRTSGLCPSLHYKLPYNISEQSALRFFKSKKNRDEMKELEQFDIREVKDLDRKNYILYITNWRISKNKS